MGELERFAISEMNKSIQRLIDADELLEGIFAVNSNIRVKLREVQFELEEKTNEACCRIAISEAGNKMNFQTYQYTVARYYITALEYGDCSSFSLGDKAEEERENKQVDAFVESLPRDSQGRIGHFAWPDNEDTDFSRCEISGLMADCVEVDYLVAV